MRISDWSSDVCSSDLFDICGKSPLPAHPDTISFEEVVFEWEVTDADKAGQHELIDWLAKRSDAELYGVLGQSEKKVAALRAGLLQPDEITQPWRALRAKYENQIDRKSGGQGKSVEVRVK